MTDRLTTVAAMDQIPLGDFAPPLDAALCQYHTPVKLARRMVRWANIVPGMRVLEPSAGGGNIMRELVRVFAAVEAVEIDPRWVKVLRQEFCNKMMSMIEVIEVDFLKWTARDRYDMAVMNPPLDDGVGAHHVKHALHCAPRVISVLRGQDLHGKGRYKELWNNCDWAGLACLVRRPVYVGKGGQIETVIVDVRRRGTYHGPQRIEHWPESWS